jgi:hypothetical protein
LEARNKAQAKQEPAPAATEDFFGNCEWEMKGTSDYSFRKIKFNDRKIRESPRVLERQLGAKAILQLSFIIFERNGNPLVVAI